MTQWLLDARDPGGKPDACNNCGADAKRWVVWDNADGWSCNKCGATDGGD